MANHEQGFSYAFILLLGTVGVGLTAGFILLRPGSPASTVQPSPSIIPRSTVYSQASPQPTITPAVVYTLVNGTVYAEKDFSFTHPKDWTVTKEALAKGTGYRLSPKHIANGLGYPKIIVEQTPGSGSLIARQQVYTRQGYKERAVRVGLENALLYATQSAIKLTGNGISNDPLQVSIVPFKKTETFYVMIYEYEGAVAQEKEALFTDFLASFRFQSSTQLLN